MSVVARSVFAVLVGLALTVTFGGAPSIAPMSAQQPQPEQHIHEVPPPKVAPRVVTPGTTPGAPPSDAIVLFDGKDLSGWETEKAGPAQWTLVDGAMEVKPKAGGIRTKQPFGDCQLHIEWATPSVVKGQGQGRGNSGVFLMGRYEVQVLDSFENETYFHGQAAGVYKQHAPLVNATRKPGEWQTYDIIFHRPHFDNGGKMIKRGTFTVLHNGVLVQDHVEVMGVTTHVGPPYYEAHPDKLPLMLQDHGDLVRYRNVWIREL
jgi:hypothetical protein